VPSATRATVMRRTESVDLWQRRQG
jgi:hypothetical protein